MHPNSGRLVPFLESFELVREGRRTAEEFLADADNECHVAATLMCELACCLIAAGEDDEGGSLLVGAGMMESVQLGLVRVGTTDRQRELYLTAMREELAVLLSFVASHEGSWGATDHEAFQRLLGCKGVAFEAALATRTAILAGRHPHLADRLQALWQMKEEIARRILEGPGHEGIEAHRASLWATRSTSTGWSTISAKASDDRGEGTWG